MADRVGRKSNIGPAGTMMPEDRPPLANSAEHSSFASRRVRCIRAHGTRVRIGWTDRRAGRAITSITIEHENADRRRKIALVWTVIDSPDEGGDRHVFLACDLA